MVQIHDKIPLDDFLDYISREESIEFVDKNPVGLVEHLGEGYNLDVIVLDDGNHGYKLKGGLSEIRVASVLNKEGKSIGYIKKITPSLKPNLHEILNQSQTPLEDMYTHEIAYGFLRMNG